MDLAHRKIELQSIADYKYIHANASNAIKQRCDEHFALLDITTEQQCDDHVPADQRPLVDAQLNTYLESVFGIIRQNISVNQHQEPEISALLTSDREVEAYDSKLAAKVQAAANKVADLTKQLSDRRRETSANALERYNGKQQEASTAWNTNLEAAKHNLTSQRPSTDLNVKGLDRVQDMAKTWDTGNAELMTCKDHVNVTMQKLERASTVLEVLDNATLGA